MSEMELRRSNEIAAEMTIEDLEKQVQKIQQVMRRVMQDGTHYGVIPGTDKPTLYKPGAEKLCLLFRLDPEYESETIWDGPHMTVKTTCRLFHSPTGTRVSSGEGMCSTKESKYGTRMAKRTCPVCNVEAIIKGKAEYGGGWVCFKRQGGCGAKFADGDASIESQEVGKIENPDLADTYNTVLKMANKRALIAAVLNGTAASDIFTQDLEDNFATGAGTQQAEPEMVTEETLTLLRTTLDELAAQAPDLWAPNVLYANASKRFGTSIKALGDLTESQARTIIEGMISWSAKNPPPDLQALQEEAEVVDQTDVVVESTT